MTGKAAKKVTVTRSKGRRSKEVAAGKVAAVAGGTIFFKGGYPAAKVAMGGKPQRDGHFSGAMWRSLTPQVKRVRGKGLFLRLYFGRQTRVHEAKKMIYNKKKGRKEILWVKDSVRNRTKAWWMQYNTRKGGQPKFDLMRFSDAEIKKITAQLIGAYQLNGKPLIHGQHSKFPRFN